MKKSKKIALFLALGMIVTGLGICAVLAAVTQLDLSSLSTERYEANITQVAESFSDIRIESDVANIQFLPAQGDTCEVHCYEQTLAKHVVTVENDTLTVKVNDTRKWINFVGLFFATETVTVYLPQEQYANLSVHTDTGKIEMPEDFSFLSATVSTDTGSIDWRASAEQNLRLSTDTGKIDVSGVTVGNLLEVETDTGKITLSNCKAGRLDAENDTGKVLLTSTTADSISVESDTGDVVFDRADAAQISVQTSTGDVTGTLLSPKVFHTETSTGKISVPNSEYSGEASDSGICDVKTSTGDIELSISQ